MREHVLAAATALFYRRGIHAVTVNEIAADAGVTKVSLYHRFASKDLLAAACLERAAAADRAVIDATRATTPGGPLRELRAVVRALADRIGPSHPQCWSATIIAADLSDPNHPARAVADTARGRARGLFVNLAEAAGAARPQLLADGLLLLLDGAAIGRRFAPEDRTSAYLIDATEALLLGQGLGRETCAAVA